MGRYIGDRMREEKIVKMSGKQFEQQIRWPIVMLLCYVVAAGILISYSARYILAFLIPICYALFRLKQILTEKNSLVDVICVIEIKPDRIEMTTESAQPKLCGTYSIPLGDDSRFDVDEKCRIVISFNDTNTNNHITMKFTGLTDDSEYWKAISKLFQKT